MTAVITPLAIQARDARIQNLERALADHKVMLGDALDREAKLKAEAARLTAALYCPPHGCGDPDCGEPCEARQ